MDKSTFFTAYGSLKSEPFKMPDGQEVTLHELTAKQRGSLLDAAKSGDQSLAMATAVAMGCDIFSEEDIDGLLALPFSLIDSMGARVLALSSLTEDDDDEAKNA